jgi:methyl-accepting chemotaxis protein
MGLGAPMGWLIVDILFCRPAGESIIAFSLREITRSPQQMLLFMYMTFATSVVLSVTGYMVGRGFDGIDEKAQQLKEVHGNIAEQKKDFENRFVRLHTDMTNLYRIGADIQRSLSREQVLELIAEGAHGLLNFDRVNIFLLNRQKETLECRESRGHHGSDCGKLKIPLSAHAGVLIRVIKENKVFFVPDMAKVPRSFRLAAPWDRMPEIRSSAFACIPLRERGEAIGLIAVDNKYQKTEIREEQLSTLKILADQGSVAITNISLFRGIHQLHRELERNFDELLDRKEKFSSLVEGLAQQSRLISANIEQVATNAEGLSERVNETTSSSQAMAGSLNEISSTVKHLSGQSERTLASAEEMSLSIQQIESNVLESNTLSKQVKQEAQDGAVLVENSLRGIEKIQEIVSGAVDAIGSLDRRTEAINEVLNVINGINEKTSVLALNASIISAQAGDQGKGFGVVSNEIRALSEQTVASSKEIEEMIETVQKDVRDAVLMIESIPAQVNEVIGLVRQSEKALSKILQSALSSLTMTEEIEKTTGVQVQNTEVVFQAFGKVKEIIEKINNSIEEQNRGGQSIGRASEYMRKLTEQVAGAAIEQSKGFQHVVSTVNQVSEMMSALFHEAEQRRMESQSIIRGIELLDDKKISA